MGDRSTSQGISGTTAELYDVFVDWEGRLGRELPGLTARLRDAGARRILDAGCGTGRHVKALLDAGFDAVGADVSEAMLAQARDHVGQAERLFPWRLGEPAPRDLAARGPFDAIVALGNVWPQLTEEGDIRVALEAFRDLLHPGGTLILGLKAVAIRHEQRDPYLPLLRREKDGEALFFVRFVDLSTVAKGCVDFHMTVLRGDADSERREALEHRVGRWRVWSPETLSQAVAGAGFDRVELSAGLGQPQTPPSGEDVVLQARRAGT